MTRNRKEAREPWSSVYQRSFERFIGSTNEKEVILGKLLDDISAYKPSSLLDIGAGNGALSIPLSRAVDEYTAIEANPSFARNLRSNGISVIEDIFPFSLNKPYDYVLASHSITYVRGPMERMVKGAWKALSPDGMLTVITLARNVGDDWSQMMDRVGLRYGLRFPDGHDRMVKLLGELGSVSVEKVTTTVTTKTTDDMVEALSFVGSNAFEDYYRLFMSKSAEVAELLDLEYKNPNGYSFPFEHFFYRTKKNSSRTYTI